MITEKCKSDQNMLTRTLKQFMNLGEISQKQMPEMLVLVLYPAVEPLVAKCVKG